MAKKANKAIVKSKNINETMKPQKGSTPNSTISGDSDLNLGKNGRRCEIKKKVALIAEVKFYFSVDDLEDVDDQVWSAKELFLSQKKHLVYGFNIIGKCFIFKGFYSNMDGFFCARQYDPIRKRIFEKGR